VSGRSDDGDDRWVPPVGEREGNAGLGWLGVSWAGWFPGLAQLGWLASLFILFFSSASLSLLF
jgi:hypothetical protein